MHRSAEAVFPLPKVLKRYLKVEPNSDMVSAEKAVADREWLLKNG
jgi:hypothetical protein